MNTVSAQIMRVLILSNCSGVANQRDRVDWSGSRSVVQGVKYCFEYEKFQMPVDILLEC